MTKLAYGGVGYNGWDNKHNDMRNVVEFASRELFKKMPLHGRFSMCAARPATRTRRRN